MTDAFLPPDPAWTELLAGLPEQTLDGAVHAASLRHPGRQALVDARRQFTYAELEHAVGQLAGALVRAGLTPGGRLVAFVRRTWELPLVFLATVRAGGVFVPLDPDGDPDRLAAVLALGCDLVFAPAGADVAADLAVAQLGDRGRVVRGGVFHPGHPLLEAWLTQGGRGRGPSDDASAVCYWNLTSGSTGVPKAAPTTHAQVLWNTRACLETFSWRPDERYLCLFAASAHPHEHWARPLTTGGTCVMSAATRPRTQLQVIRDQRVGWLFCVPSTLRLLADAAVAPVGPLRLCETGGALVDPRLVAHAEARLGCDVMPIWGCTEATGVVLHVAPGPGRDLGGLGSPLRHYQAVLRDPRPDGGVGELALAGPAVVRGYADGREAERFAGGWYRSGDLVRADGHGGFRFAGRLDDVIKVAGRTVYLVEIEQALQAHSGIDEVAVVPAADGTRGEVPRAIVVPSDPALTPAALTLWCRTHLRPEQLPRRIELVSELPRAASGKLDRAALRRS